MLDGASGLQVSGKYAYVASLTSSGVEILDISDPTNPVHAGSILDTGTTELAGAFKIYVSGKYAYVTGLFDDGVEILDITGIDTPAASIGNIEAGYLSVIDNAVIGNSIYSSGLNVGQQGIHSTGDVAFSNSTLVTLSDNVGIGTTTPSQELNVIGDGLFTGFLNSTSLEVLQTGSSIAANITNTGTGDSFRVNDDSGDITPFVIDSDGLVGIGTTSPLEELHILGDLLVNGFGNFTSLNITQTTTSANIVALNVTNLGAGESFVVNDESSDTTPFVIDGTGNVGIGTTLGSSPTSILTLAGSFTATTSGTFANFTDNYIVLSEQITPANPSSDTIVLYSRDDGSGNSALYFKDDAGTENALSGAIMATSVNTFTANQIFNADVTLGSDNADTITVNGRITNGTQFEIVDRNIILGDVDADDGNINLHGNVVMNGTTIKGGSLVIGSTTYGDSSITQSTGNSLGITLGGAAGDDFIVDTNTLVVESDNDRVGIGTASPGALLDVDGDARFNSISTASGTTGDDLSITLGSGTAGDGGDFTVNAGDGTTGGGEITLTAGSPTAGNLNGGDVNIIAGTGSGTGGIGGVVDISSGTGDGNSGNVLIRSANSIGGFTNSGNVQITTGTAVGNSISGDISLIPGVGGNTGTGGKSIIKGGSGGTIVGTGGAVTIDGGSAIGTTSGNGGAVTINGGSGSPITGNGGDVTIDGGSVTSGTVGDVILQQAGGYVGIGTTTPSQELNVAGDGLFTGFLNSTSLEVSQTGSSIAANVTNTGSGYSLLVNDESGDTTPFVIDSSGNVGIGTTSPFHTLNVVGSANITDTIIFSDNSTQFLAATPSGFDWHILTAVFKQSKTITESANERALFFKPDGKTMYVGGQSTTGEIFEFNLSTAWDMSTASHDQTIVVGSEGNPSGLYFRQDGLKMYFVGFSSGEVNEYTLSIPWDISSRTHVQAFGISAQENFANGIWFKPDGKKMYIVGGGGDEVNEYNLSTPWDISTAIPDNILNVSSEGTFPEDLLFSPDGTQLYVTEGSGNEINEYFLSVPWNLSTAVFRSVLDVSAQVSSSPFGAFLRHDGTKMYVLSPNDSAVFEYDLGLIIEGKMGIGTTSPSQELNVVGDGLFTGFLNSTSLEVSQTGSSIAANVTNTGSGYSLLVNDESSDTTPFVIDNSGNVFVGATTETIGNTGFSQDGDDVFIFGTLGVEGNIYTDSSFIAGSASTTYGDGTIAESSGPLSISLNGAAGDDFTVDTSTLVVESDNNRVGIGTTSPDAKLQLADFTVGTPGLHIRVNDPGSDFDYTAIKMSMGGYEHYIGQNLNILNFTAKGDATFGEMIFNVGAGTTLAMSIDAAGEIGISGCDDPDHDLTIGGTGTGCNTGTYSEIDAGESSFTTSSSRTIKENIEPVSVDNILGFMLNIPVHTYDFKPQFCNSNDTESCRSKIGLIAEDFYPIFERGSDKMLSGQEVQMALWLATQELAKQNELQKHEIESLKELICIDHPASELCDE